MTSTNTKVVAKIVLTVAAVVLTLVVVAVA